MELFLKVISLYRLPEIFQVFGICVSMLFFARSFEEPQLFLLWALSLASAISSAFWTNDYFDFEDDRANERKLPHRSKNAALIPAVVSFVISLVSGALVSSGVLLTVSCTSFVSYLYSSPLLRLKSRIYLPFLIHFVMGVLFFQSAASICDFQWTKESLLMSLFWALILGTGSLGNELEDQSVDEKARIRTIANAYPQRVRKLIIGAQALALGVLAMNMVILSLKISLLISLGAWIIYFLMIRSRGKNWEASTFRSIYRRVFVIIIVAFHAEKFLRS